jgi:prepilin-type processing-associated H-X9-DG protein
MMADSAQIDATNKLKANPFLSPPSQSFPNFHGLHTEFGNVLWLDGHVKAVRPIYRSGSIFGVPATTYQGYKLGDIDEDGNLNTDELFDGSGGEK